MQFIKKNLTATASGERIKSAIACTYRAHAAAIKAAATVHYVDNAGIDKSFFALTTSLDPLFKIADRLDDEVISACLLTAGYRSGRDLTEFSSAVKTAAANLAPLDKRDTEIRKRAAACGDDVEKHNKLLQELDRLKPALGAARDALEKAHHALEEELLKDCHAYLRGFDKRAAMLTAVSEWLYANAADRFGKIADAADTAVRERAAEFAGRMLACVDFIASDGDFPLNQKGRRCSCGADIETAIMKAVKRPFNGGVGYKHTATGGVRYCDVPAKAGNEVTIMKVTD